MPAIGTIHIASIRIAAEKPASVSEPKPFTTDCTSIIPMETVDCCRMEGSAIRDMVSNSIFENTCSLLPPIFLSCAFRTTKDRRAEIPCAISVAHATPAIPILNVVTEIQSRRILNRDEKIKKARGILDVPSALKIDDSTLYIKRKGIPKKEIFR